MSEIKAGDLVMVVRGCCPHRSWGVPWRVEYLFNGTGGTCVVCGKQVASGSAAGGQFYSLLSWLIKIDPPATGDEVSMRKENKVPA